MYHIIVRREFFMKNLITTASAILVSAAVLSVVPTCGETELYKDVLRFHVIAESDSEDDQELKLKVRDSVLAYIESALSVCETYEEAYETVGDMLGEIEQTAGACIKNNGYGYSVTASLERERYPRKEYGDAVMPAGVYNSLKIVIGKGEGHNWWCVLFPTVCVRFASAGEDEYIAAGFTPEEYRIITGKNGGWKVRFKVLELLSDLFGFEY